MNSVKRNCNVFLANSDDTTDSDEDSCVLAIMIDQQVCDFTDLVASKVINGLFVPVTGKLGSI